jgi:uncharacterized protein YjbJ (UPF0337 family)
MKGEVKTRWGKLTDDDLDVIAGKRDQLVGRIQERYGVAKDQAQQEVDDWNRNLARDTEAQRQTDRDLDRKAS